MRAFVLSGGGNLGPTQVGALRALLERNIGPEMVVGCSAGALNAAFFARDPTPAQVEALARIWRSVSQTDIYPGTRLGSVWRFMTGKDSLYDNRNFYEFLQRSGTTPARTFGNFPVPLYLTATDLHTGKLFVFGDNPHDRVLDGLMASTALTPLHPPWEVNGERYIDGGTVTPLPLRVAMERGASEIYALHVTDQTPDEAQHGLIHGVAAVLTRSVNTMLRLQVEHDLLLAEVASQVRLHYIRIQVSDPPDPMDFGQPDRLIEIGYQATAAYLMRQEPTAPAAPVRSTTGWRRLQARIGRWSALTKKPLADSQPNQ